MNSDLSLVLICLIDAPVHMPVYNLFVINKAGSLIYDSDVHAPNTSNEVERRCTYPLDIQFKVIDQRAIVTFVGNAAETSGAPQIRPGMCLLAINGERVFSGDGGRPCIEKQVTVPAEGDAPSSTSSKQVDALEYLTDAQNFPLTLRFGRAALTSNEKIILSSMFHSLFAIAAQISPVEPVSGIQRIQAEHYSLHCLQTLTGIKILAVVDNASTTAVVRSLLHRVYTFYADYALKNPFYTMEMPIRCSLFDQAIDNLLATFNRSGSVMNV